MKKLTAQKMAVVASLLIAMLVLSGCGRMMHRMMHRLESRMEDRMGGERFGHMHDFGNRMMPFGLGAHGERGEMADVSHIFDKTDDGGVYQVIADDTDDAETIAMIQERLAGMADRVGAETSMDADGEEADGEEAADEEANSEEAEGEGDDGEEAHDGKRADADGRHNRGMRRGQGIFGRGMGELMNEISITYSDLDDGGQITISSENPDVVEMIHAWIDEGPMGRGMRDGRGQR